MANVTHVGWTRRGFFGSSYARAQSPDFENNPTSITTTMSSSLQALRSFKPAQYSQGNFPSGIVVGLGGESSGSPAWPVSGSSVVVKTLWRMNKYQMKPKPKKKKTHTAKTTTGLKEMPKILVPRSWYLAASSAAKTPVIKLRKKTPQRKIATKRKNNSSQSALGIRT